MEASESDHSSYIYKPLEGLETIRILTLCAVSEAGVECTIEQVDVNQGARTYQALSYVWGSEGKVFKAVVRETTGGKMLGSISISTNLNSAMHDIWNAEELKSKVLWIDQICIDQQGTEKGQQVSLMGQIYKNAATVITYLGPVAEADSELEQRGLQLLKQLYQHFTPNFEILTDVWDAADVHERRSELPVLSLPEDFDESANEEILQWLASLCVGEWASRLWIVQEQLLNDAEIVMLRGTRLLAWDMVTAMAIFWSLQILSEGPLLRYFNAASWTSSLTDPRSLLTSVFSLWNARRKKDFSRPQVATSSSTNHTLFSNLLNYEQLQCRDPRDRIFALLAVSSDAKTDLGIIPNYEEPATHTFWRVSIAIFEKKAYRSLDLLAMACQLEKCLDLDYPSWCLKIPPPRRMRSFYLIYGRYNPHPCDADEELERPRFGFLEEASPKWKRSINRLPPIMILKGRILESVSFACKPFFPSEATLLGGVVDDAQIQSLALLLLSFVEILDNIGLTLPNTAAMCRTLLAESSNSSHMNNTTQSYIAQVAYEFWCFIFWMSQPPTPLSGEFEEKGKHFHRLVKDLRLLLSEAGHDMPQDAHGGEYFKIGRRFMDNFYFRGRGLGVTVQRRIFNAMNEVKHGDVIAAIQGTDRLFVLRPDLSGHRYQLVGDVYVDGLMHGEAYEGLDPQSVDHDIELI